MKKKVLTKNQPKIRLAIEDIKRACDIGFDDERQKIEMIGEILDGLYVDELDAKDSND